MIITVKDKGYSEHPERKSLFEFVKPVLIRNIERDNTSGNPGTEWTIDGIDKTSHIITIDNPVPKELSKLYGDNPATDEQNRWTILDATNINYYNRIVRIEASTNFDIIHYENMAGVDSSLDFGTKIVFYNPFRSFKFANYYSVLSIQPDTWYSKYAWPGPIWKHSDGNYRMCVNGFDDSSIWRIGLASSPNLINWTVLNSGNYMYDASSFNKSWIQSLPLMSGSATRIPDTSSYAAIIKAYDGVSTRIGTTTFDENFNLLTVSDVIEIPDVSIAPGFHMQFGDLTYFENQWLVSTCKRYPVQVNSEIYVLTLSNVYDASVRSKELIQKNGVANTWTANTLEYTYLLQFNNRLYLFLSGEALSDDVNVGAICQGNRLYGIYEKTRNGWVLGKGSPYLTNPVAVYYSYNDIADFSWCDDHMGAGISTIQEGEYIYFMCTFKTASPRYDTGLYKLHVNY